MYVISIKVPNGPWMYLSKNVNRCNNSFASNLSDSFNGAYKYNWTAVLEYAKIFESVEEAKIFWKVSSDKRLIHLLDEIRGQKELFNTDNGLAIRKIIFKTEYDFPIA